MNYTHYKNDFDFNTTSYNSDIYGTIKRGSCIGYLRRSMVGGEFNIAANNAESGTRCSSEDSSTIRYSWTFATRGCKGTVLSWGDLGWRKSIFCWI